MAKVLTSHDDIRLWFTARTGNPAISEQPDGKGGTFAVLRILFGQAMINQQSGLQPDEAVGRAAPVSWEEWFEEFDRQNLAVRVPDEGGFHDSRFEFVNKNDLE